ncbi:pectinesterase [Ranunculus cassubicifolius]
MALGIFVALLFLSLFSAPSPVTSFQTVPPHIKKWCGETPNPEPCEFFFSQKPNCESVKDKASFKKMAMQIALDRTVRAEGITKGLNITFRNKKEKVAWDDCVELYEDTLHKLNKTIDQDGKCSHDDSQTWLSAALTNLATCWTGFEELGVADHILPMMKNNNVSKLICNTLEINKAPPAKPTYTGGFPDWVNPGDRKLLQAAAPKANLVVAKDGSGNFRTVKQAFDAAAKRKGTGRFVIYVKAGVYSENVVAGSKVKNVMLVGDGIGKTILTGSKSVGGGSTTFASATFSITGGGFIARGVTFRNTAGAANHQAVAMRSGSDLSVFYRCSFEGYQDTLYAHSQRQFYKECNVYGTVDFIFGNSAVVLQNCNIYCRKPIKGQQCTITAQGRMDKNQNTGISIHNSQLLATSDLGATPSYLGRPWKQYSRTVYMQTFMGRHINPAGWLPWNGNFALSTLYYGEYRNTGPGSSTARRVKWGGYRVITNPAEASRFTVGSFLAGRSWLPGTGVPFTSGL